jgi:ATP-binding cassette subfamily B (MDR/TAP) protein 1
MNSSTTQNLSSLEKGEDKSEEVTFLQMFRFAKQRDLIYIGLGVACSILIGGALPFFSYLWGNMTDAFRDPNQMVEQAFNVLVEYLIFGAASIFIAWGMQYFWLIAGESQANECRRQYLNSLLKQEVGWFETQQSSEIVSRFTSDTLAFQLAIGEKISLVVYLLSMFLSGFIISVMHGWELTLVILACLPLLIFSFWIMEIYAKGKAAYEEEIFQSASGIAQ